MNSKISVLSKVLLAIAAVCLAISIFVPIWQIQLAAPQYPEGLTILIFANKLAGDVETINGLNHYIGMKTLHAKDFIEFSVLVYIIGAYAIFTLITAVVGNKKLLYTLFTLFALFGILAMVDFWRWEYDYGHDLDPNAAISIPGMAYQPPLIGFKQLLNFGAYSIPDVGGWLFVVAGLLMLFCVVNEGGLLNRFKKNKGQTIAIFFIISFFIQSCGSTSPEPITLNSTDCDYCKMSISDPKFACEIVTAKGRVYKFDDLICLTKYQKDNQEKSNGAKIYVSDYLKPHKLLAIEKVILVKGEKIASPMSGNMAAFSNKDSTIVYTNSLSAEQISWEKLD